MGTIEENKKLIERYPFLQPHNVWIDKISEDYDYGYTILDEVEDGWQELFLQMCEEIREPLIEANYLDKFRFSQIKEKYGSLRMYNFGAPEAVHNIINKYERLSTRICVRCGKTATKISQGWICPYCDDCAAKIDRYESFVSIDEWFEEKEDE